MSKTGEFIGALAANFIVAGIVAKLQGAGAAAVSFTIGLALLAVYFLFFRKKNETASSQPIHIENKPNISPNISPNVSPTFSQTFNPTIKVEFPTATAPAPAALPESRPKLTFDKWDTIAETLDLWQSGFRITNHGEVAIDVRIKRFEVAPGQFATSGTLTAISARSKAFIPVVVTLRDPQGRWNPVLADCTTPAWSPLVGARRQGEWGQHTRHGVCQHHCWPGLAMAGWSVMAKEGAQEVGGEDERVRGRDGDRAPG